MDYTVWNRMQKQILGNDKDKNKRCVYCGKLFDSTEGILADDYGLHYETAAGMCCNSCNSIVTMTNIYISRAIHSSTEKEKKKHIKEAIDHLVKINEVLNNGGSINGNNTGVQ